MHHYYGRLHAYCLQYADANMISKFTLSRNDRHFHRFSSSFSQHRPWALVIRWAKWSNCSSHHCSWLLAWLMWMADFSLHTANADYRPSYCSLLMAIICFTLHLFCMNTNMIIGWHFYGQKSPRVSGKFSQRFLSQLANANIYARALHDSTVSRQLEGQW